MNTNEKIALLRAEMKKNNLNYYIITSADAHQSEYVPAHWKSREWLSGFTGSAGTVVVTTEQAFLWADGRYHIQAAKEIEGSEINLFKWGLEGVPDFITWLAENVKTNEICGFDGRTISEEQFKRMESLFKGKNISFVYNIDLIGDIWSNRPTLPSGKAFEHTLEYAGVTRTQKIAEVRLALEKKNAKATVISSLDDIAWLFNLRGDDVYCTPVVSSYAYIDDNKAVLFISDNKLENSLKTSLLNDKIEIKDYNDIFKFISGISVSSIYVDPNNTSIRIKDSISKDIEIVQGDNITSELKAVKNIVEQMNIEKTQIKDGVAMVKFLIWLENSVGKIELEEADIHDKLLELRAQNEDNRGASFETIAAYEENAASMHYSPEKGKSKKLLAKNMLLVDTGGQYLGGTTDITRTIMLGETSQGMKEDFTLVLKSHIALATARFLKGCAGINLDILARQPLWERGLDYKCGTGHGVGYFLGVHEGPQNISPSARSSAVIKPGMYITNEPGIYREGKWGIRTENTLLVRQDETNENGTFLSFDTISYCPIDVNGIVCDMLTDKEKNWLNSYHAVVYSKLFALLDEDERRWLKERTKAI